MSTLTPSVNPMPMPPSPQGAGSPAAAPVAAPAAAPAAPVMGAPAFGAGADQFVPAGAKPASTADVQFGGFLDRWKKKVDRHNVRADAKEREKDYEVADEKLLQETIRVKKDHKEVRYTAAEAIAEWEVANKKLNRALEEAEQAKDNAARYAKQAEAETDEAKKAAKKRVATTEIKKYQAKMEEVEDLKRETEMLQKAMEQAKGVVAKHRDAVKRLERENAESIRKFRRLPAMERVAALMEKLEALDGLSVATDEASMQRERIEREFEKQQALIEGKVSGNSLQETVEEQRAREEMEREAEENTFDNFLKEIGQEEGAEEQKKQTAEGGGGKKGGGLYDD